MLQVHVCAPFKDFSIQRKTVRALDYVFRWQCTGNRKMSKASASTRLWFPFSSHGAEGAGDKQTLDCFPLCI